MKSITRFLAAERDYSFQGSRLYFVHTSKHTATAPFPTPNIHLSSASFFQPQFAQTCLTSICNNPPQIHMESYPAVPSHSSQSLPSHFWASSFFSYPSEKKQYNKFCPFPCLLLPCSPNNFTGSAEPWKQQLARKETTKGMDMENLPHARWSLH